MAPDPQGDDVNDSPPVAPVVLDCDMACDPISLGSDDFRVFAARACAGVCPAGFDDDDDESLDILFLSFGNDRAVRCGNMFGEGAPCVPKVCWPEGFVRRLADCIEDEDMRGTASTDGTELDDPSDCEEPLVSTVVTDAGVMTDLDGGNMKDEAWEAADSDMRPEDPTDGTYSFEENPEAGLPSASGVFSSSERTSVRVTTNHSAPPSPGAVPG